MRIAEKEIWMDLKMHAAEYLTAEYRQIYFTMFQSKGKWIFKRWVEVYNEELCLPVEDMDPLDLLMHEFAMQYFEIQRDLLIKRRRFARGNGDI